MGLSKNKINLPEKNASLAEFIPDRQLIAQALIDNQAALELLVKRYLGLVYSIAKYYVVSSDDAADVTQEVFIKVWKNLKKFKLEKKFSSWLGEIAKNTALDWLKKKKAVALSTFDDNFGHNQLIDTIVDLAPTLDEQVYQANLLETLQLALDKLAGPYRQVIEMHDWQEMTFKEIAASTNQPLNTVKSRYHRAVGLLKKISSDN